MTRAALCDAVELVREDWRAVTADMETMRALAALGWVGFLLAIGEQVVRAVLNLP